MQSYGKIITAVKRRIRLLVCFPMFFRVFSYVSFGFSRKAYKQRDLWYVVRPI